MSKKNITGVTINDKMFKLILNKDEIGHEYFITHSSDVTSKRHDMLKGVKLAESVLMKIY